MRLPLPEIEPVAFLIEAIETSGDLRFSGIDLESGARVSLLIERKPNDNGAQDVQTLTSEGLVLVLTMETLGSLS